MPINPGHSNFLPDDAPLIAKLIDARRGGGRSRAATVYSAALGWI
jgi:hypothetical protein